MAIATELLWLQTFLSHSNLYAAGIARSGAYNRTLTPFGFQSEQRSYWEAPNVYYTMSPFMHAEKMKTPLLLIHGEDDNNSGTYPMQSERYFNALKGLGSNSWISDVAQGKPWICFKRKYLSCSLGTGPVA